MFKRLFTDHPESVGESYREHAAVAASFGAAMVLGGFACFVHAVVPALCTRTGSGTIRRLHDEMAARNAGAQAAGEREAPFSYVI